MSGAEQAKQSGECSFLFGLTLASAQLIGKLAGASQSSRTVIEDHSSLRAPETLEESQELREGILWLPTTEENGMS